VYYLFFNYWCGNQFLQKRFKHFYKSNKDQILKILIFNTLYYPIQIGGAEVSVRDLAKELQKSGIEVGIVTLGEKNEKYLDNGILVWRIKLKNMFWPFAGKIPPWTLKSMWHVIDVFNPRYKKEFDI